MLASSGKSAALVAAIAAIGAGSSFAAEPVWLHAFGDAGYVSPAASSTHAPATWVVDRLRKTEALRSPHLNFLNFEATPVVGCQKTAKKSFRFLAAPETISQFAAWGFNVMALANNHTADCIRPWPWRQWSQVWQRINSSGSRVPHVHGLAATEAAALKPTVINYRGLRIGFASVKGWYNGRFPVPNLGNHKDLLRALAAAQVDVRVVSLHGGKENTRLPTREFREIARSYLDHYQVDLVLGHHSHTMQGVEIRQQPDQRLGLIVYSLGNFLHNGLSANGDGLMARIALTKQGIDFRRISLHALKHASHFPQAAGHREQTMLRQILYREARHQRLGQQVGRASPVELHFQSQQLPAPGWHVLPYSQAHPKARAASRR